MIAFRLNGQSVDYSGDPAASLLSFLRRERRLTAAKDGCSGQAACGACLVEVNGRACLACSTPMSKVNGGEVVTLEGLPEPLRRTLGMAFVNRGAVQCGFCTPSFLMRAKVLLQGNRNPSREEVVKAVRPHLCRCTGYVKIVDAILDAAALLREGKAPETDARPGLGSGWPKDGGYERAIGTRPFVNDMEAPGMAHGALVFSEHPRARVLAIHTEEAAAMPGVIRILRAEDIPGERVLGLYAKDWPVYVKAGEITRYIGDALACVIAESEEEARAAAARVRADYEVLTPLLDMEEAEHSSIRIHERGNVLLDKSIRRGEPVDEALSRCAFTAEAVYTTQAVEHAFLETEACLALPEDGGVRLYVQSQGIWHDKADIAALLRLPSPKVTVTLADAGGAFGGKEDFTCQPHAALGAYLLGRPVKVRLSRPESIRMHPKRHAMKLHYVIGCDEKGLLMAAKARILADTGAYASAGGPVVTRTGTHAVSAYHVPSVDIHVKAVFTNNQPAGAFRGFGVNQSNFAMECLIDELCEKGGFDRWQFRYDNAVAPGRMVTTGQVLGEGTALRETLLAVRDAFRSHPRAGIACAIKNAGIGNGIPEPCDCYLEVHPAPDDPAGARLVLHHGWSEMGQGINTVARTSTSPSPPPPNTGPTRAAPRPAGAPSSSATPWSARPGSSATIWTSTAGGSNASRGASTRAITIPPGRLPDRARPAKSATTFPTASPPMWPSWTKTAGWKKSSPRMTRGASSTAPFMRDRYRAAWSWAWAMPSPKAFPSRTASCFRAGSTPAACPAPRTFPKSRSSPWKCPIPRAPAGPRALGKSPASPRLPPSSTPSIRSTACAADRSR